MFNRIILYSIFFFKCLFCNASIIDTTSNNIVLENKIEIVQIESAKHIQFKYAILLGVELESLSNLKLLDFIESWMGTRYLYGGVSKKGVDCSAFTQILLKEVYNIPTHRIVGDQYNNCEPIERKNLKLGDLLFFKTDNKNRLGHVAFYLGNNSFIHASVNKGITIDNLNNRYYANAFRLCGRPKYKTI